jgi:hypothetical protein
MRNTLTGAAASELHIIDWSGTLPRTREAAESTDGDGNRDGHRRSCGVSL